MEVQDRLLKLIEEMGYNPNSFAEKLGIDPSTINHIIKGRRNKPSFVVIEKIAMAFANVDLRWLITGKREPKPPKEAIDSGYQLPEYLMDIAVNDPSSEKLTKTQRIVKLESTVLPYETNTSCTNHDGTFTCCQDENEGPQIGCSLGISISEPEKGLMLIRCATREQHLAGSNESAGGVSYSKNYTDQEWVKANSCADCDQYRK